MDFMISLNCGSMAAKNQFRRQPELVCEVLGVDMVLGVYIVLWGLHSFRADLRRTSEGQPDSGSRLVAGGGGGTVLVQPWRAGLRVWESDVRQKRRSLLRGC